MNTPNLKITFSTASSHTQGTYFRWHNLAIGLQKLGHQVTIHAIGPRHYGRTQLEERDGVRYILVPSIRLIPNRLLDPKLDPITLLRAIWHAPEPSDIYHIFQPFSHSCLPGLIHRTKARRLIFDWDDLWWGGLIPAKKGFPWPSTWPPRVTRLLEDYMPQSADGVTTCSEFLAQAAQRNGATEMQVIHNGYWPSEAVPTKAAARESFGLDPHAFYFGFMGRTISELEWCLDSLEARCSAGRKVRLALCGMPSSVIEALPSEKRGTIDYLGNLSPKQTQEFARAIDSGLLPLENSPFNQSRFPIKFAEYLAGGAHVVASSVGEFTQIAAQLGGVTLAGTSRDSWKTTLATLDLADFERPIKSGKDSPLAQNLGWLVHAQKLEDFYHQQLSQ